MKHLKYKYTIWFLILLISLSGCESSKYTENTYIEGQDFQYMYFRQGSSQIMAESENGYYFFSGYYLHYADKQNMKPVILCNKPNCLHDKETDPKKVYNCNAFFSNGTSPFIACYDSSIYVLSSVLGKGRQESELLKVSADGTKRKSILKFEVKPVSLAIHRGKLYYEQTAYDKNQKSVYSIKVFDINKLNAKPENIYTGSLEGGHIQDLMCYGNNLYFLEFAHNKKSFADIKMRYDILTGKIGRLYTDDVDSDDLVLASYPSIYNGKIYYFVSKYNADGTVQTKTSFICDLEGGHKQKNFDIDKDSVFLADRQYLYSNDIIWSADAKPKEQQKLRILDSNGKVMDSIDTGSINDNSSVMCGGEQHLFIISGTKDKFQIFYVNKKQFGTGKIELKPFFITDRDRMTPAIVTGNELNIEN